MEESQAARQVVGSTAADQVLGRKLSVTGAANSIEGLPARWNQTWPGPPVVPFYPFSGEGSPTKIDYERKGSLILTSLLEDLVGGGC